MTPNEVFNLKNQRLSEIAEQLKIKDIKITNLSTRLIAIDTNSSLAMTP